jgi:sensor histidine kinase YesM
MDLSPETATIMSTPTNLLERRWVRWALYLGFWTLFGLFNVGQSYFLLQWQNRNFDLGNALILGLSDWYLWAAFALVIVWLGRRFPLEQKAWAQSLLVHLLACLLFSLLTVALITPIYRYCSILEYRHMAYTDLFTRLFLGEILFYSWMYFAVLGASYAIDYYRRYRERELRTSQLEGQLARAQLQVLKMQLHPHFLFNTLHAISSLMHRDVDVADRMIARLGELLRQTLTNDGTQEVPLRQELEFIQPYLEIEQARLGSRLSVRLDIDAEVMDAMVPNLILQPLVENAIHYAIAPRADGGCIAIRARRENGSLRLEVEDDGPGLAGKWREGIGLSNTRARLLQLYGEAQRLELSNGQGHGLLVTMTIPYREAPQHTSTPSGQTNDAPSCLASAAK